MADRSGSITLMVPFDFGQPGADPLYYQSYSAFGELQLDLPEDFDFRFGYTAREWDAETELNYHRARYYDPGQGRFISQDPLGLDAGDVNLYRYVGNSPLNYVDPSGLARSGVCNQAQGIVPASVSHALQPGGYAGGRWNPANWSRWLYTGDANAPDVLYDLAREGGGDNYSNNQAREGLRHLAIVDPTGVADATNAVLEGIEGVL